MKSTPFRPHYGTCQVVTAGAASASININGNDKTVRVVNSGAAIAYFRIANEAKAATTADCPIASGATVVVEKSMDGFTFFSYISAAGSTLSVITGEGGY